MDEDANGEGGEGNNANGDELFAIGRELSEKQTKREKELQTQKIKIQPDSILRRFGTDEDDLDRREQLRDNNLLDARQKVHFCYIDSWFLILSHCVSKIYLMNVGGF